MGHSSKFAFPLPGRKPKAAPAGPPPGPWATKAQRILGNAEINDQLARQPWETSTVGIGIAISDIPNGDIQDGRASRNRRWEEESDIIPIALDNGTPLSPDIATDASSLRRQQSSSTIRSFYDKTKLPLSISQQTSNSAMAKGLPAKAQALLDIDGEYSDMLQPKKARKKPSKLDLSGLIQKHISPKHLNPANWGLPSRPESAADSVSSTSAAVSPAPTFASMPTQGEYGQRPKTNRGRERPSPADQIIRPVSAEDRPSKASVELHNLYDHYEQRTFADSLDRELLNSDFSPLPSPGGPLPAFPLPPNVQPGRAYLAPGNQNTRITKQQGLSAIDLRVAGAMSPSNSVPADCASVSSRHTRTSKASRTDHSLQEIDLLQNSVLALSSDSEDDYDEPPRDGLTVPHLSEGQLSPASPQSPALPLEGSKTSKTQGVVPGPPKIAPRTSSLNARTYPILVSKLNHETSRLSINTTSTDRTITMANATGDSPDKAVRKMRSESEFQFPAPPLSRGSRSASVSHVTGRAMSPSNMDTYPSAIPEDDILRTERRNSTSSSINESTGERFMAVTRQEEMLLSALRQKRARMREDMTIDVSDKDAPNNKTATDDPAVPPTPATVNSDVLDQFAPLTRQTTQESMMPCGMSRQSSVSTHIAQLSARPRNRAGSLNHQRLRILVDNNNRMSYDTVGSALRTPMSEISDFIHHYEDSPPPPVGMIGRNNSVLASPASLSAVTGAGGLKREDSRASSIASSQRSVPIRHRASLSAMAGGAPPGSASSSLRRPRRDGSAGSMSRRDSSRRRAAAGAEQVAETHHVLEDLVEDDDEPGIPRPDSPISPEGFGTVVKKEGIRDNKAVRLSAVGLLKPNDDA